MFKNFANALAGLTGAKPGLTQAEVTFVNTAFENKGQWPAGCEPTQAMKDKLAAMMTPTMQGGAKKAGKKLAARKPVAKKPAAKKPAAKKPAAKKTASKKPAAKKPAAKKAAAKKK